jgi:MmpS family membrane protein
VVESGVRGVAEGPSDVTDPDRGGNSRKTRLNRGFAIFAVLGRLWIPLAILAVISAGGLTVSRLHGVFGSEKRPSYADTRINDTKSYDPKHLTYEVFGPAGTVADINYFDVHGDPQLVKGARLPWSLTFSTTQAAVVGNVVAQGDSDSIGCRLVVDGEVKAERVSNEVNAFTFCLLKAA